MPDYANGTRSFFEGLTFNNTAEVEAAARAMAEGDMANFLANYRRHKQNIDKSYNDWAEANPGSRLAGEGLGALVPGIVGAFVPGGQGATAASAARSAPLLARIGRAMAEPLTMAAERYVPGVMAKRGMPLALALGDETLTGALQSAGAADTLSEVPDQVMSDLPKNLAFSGGIRLANVAAKPVVRPVARGVAAVARPVVRVVRDSAPSSFRVPTSLRAAPLSVYDRILGAMYGNR